MVIADNLDILRGFNAKVARLEATKFHERYRESVPHVVARVEKPRIVRTGECTGEIFGYFQSSIPDFEQDEVDAFVLTYRMFVQKRDRISVFALSKIYGQEWMPPEARERFAEARREFDAFLDGTTTTAFVDEPITTRKLVDVFLYGALAHADPAKERLFKEWTADGGMTGFMWAEFIAALKRVTFFLQYFRDLNLAVIANLEPEVE